MALKKVLQHCTASDAVQHIWAWYETFADKSAALHAFLDTVDCTKSWVLGLVAVSMALLRRHPRADAVRIALVRLLPRVPWRKLPNDPRSTCTSILLQHGHDEHARRNVAAVALALLHTSTAVATCPLTTLTSHILQCAAVTDDGVMALVRELVTTQRPICGRQRLAAAVVNKAVALTRFRGGCSMHAVADALVVVETCVRKLMHEVLRPSIVRCAFQFLLGLTGGECNTLAAIRCDWPAYIDTGLWRQVWDLGAAQRMVLWSHKDVCAVVCTAQGYGLPSAVANARYIGGSVAFRKRYVSLSQPDALATFVLPACRGTQSAECVICFSTATLWQVVKTPCGHAFHGKCLGTWLAKEDTCPLCRGPVLVRARDEHLAAVGVFA